MDSDLSTRIEALLLERRDWVSTEELCFQFGLPDDRALRQAKNKPGLCTRFAISGDRGLRHVRTASTSEWLTFKHRLRKHAVSEFIRVRDLDIARHNAVRQVAPKTIFEKDTGQVLLAM
jgi:hypothetical protein